MQFRTVIVSIAGLAAAASVTAETVQANPAIKHLAARAINAYDGSVVGLIFRRQTPCAAGSSTCGSGCAAGPCCDVNAGLACRQGESCAQIDGQTGCCPDGYVCGGIRGCQDALGGYCTPGSVENGILCCDTSAPICSTSTGVPYCAGAAPNTVYTISSPNPTDSPTDTVTDAPAETTTETATETVTDATTDTATDAPAETTTDTVVYESTTTESTTSTSTLTLTLDSSSNVILPVNPTGDGDATTAPPSTETSTVTVSEPTTTVTLSETVGSPTTSAAELTEPQTSTSTWVSTTTVLVITYPVGNGTANISTGVTISLPEATGAAGRLGVSCFALTVAIGLAFVF
ncbi:hypothetical protein DRE_03965 [Drechslerella stenobrocha 248]|uniref:GPI anchored protein n=1 Tax=Drechslerella stenobrocha 248 TaxID=1043628 RepID=W7IC93_9PEZI|nr:hypothetical protein DRE_03965 [Drechslerella stenobrocha 248]